MNSLIQTEPYGLSFPSNVLFLSLDDHITKIDDKANRQSKQKQKQFKDNTDIDTYLNISHTCIHLHKGVGKNEKRL